MGSQKKQKKGLNRPEECWLTIKGDWGLQRVRDRIRLRLQASCAPFPTSFKPSPKGCRHTMIGWEENAPSCFHSSIRSQSPHLRTGDLNPCNQSWGKISTNKREKQHVSKKKTAGLLQGYLLQPYPLNLLWSLLAPEKQDGNIHTSRLVCIQSQKYSKM